MNPRELLLGSFKAAVAAADPLQIVPQHLPAPPKGTHGETQTSQPAVGAHASHLQVGSDWHRDVKCSDCHTVPADSTHSNGVLGGAFDVADLPFSVKRVAMGAPPRSLVREA